MKPLCLLITSLLSSSQAALVSVGTSHVSGGGSGDFITFNIDQVFSSSEPDGFRDFTGFFLNSTGGNTFEYGGTFLDEGVSVFFVDPNDVFSETNILGGQFTELTSGTSFTLPSSFFIGMLTPIPEVGAYDPAYGWAEIQNPGDGSLSLIDHAVVYCGEGIIVDTLTPVPEPSSLALSLISMTLLLKRRRN